MVDSTSVQVQNFNLAQLMPELGIYNYAKGRCHAVHNAWTIIHQLYFDKKAPHAIKLVIACARPIEFTQIASAGICTVRSDGLQ
jgi:hypothetical protein